MPSRDEIIFQGVLALVILALVALFVGEGLGFWDVIPQRTDRLYDLG